MKDPMLNEEFLRELDQYPHKFIWAKIVSLNFDEYPQQEITGKVTSGSINIDGSSALRRTCSLSLAAEDVNIQDFYWGLHTKFYVYIGLENFINPEYPDIIWFKQGMFMITSFSCTAGVNNYTINIQGKDKMTLLNGDLGGVIPASWDFATEDVNATDEDGKTVYDTTGYAIIENHQIPIKQIIFEAVHEFAQEPWQNIIVNDLDDYGIELLEYDGDKPFYYIIKTDVASGDNNSREVTNMTFNGDMNCWVRLDTWDVSKNQRKVATGSNAWKSGVKISELENIQGHDATSTSGALCYEKLIEQLDPSGAVIENKNYMRAIVKFNETATDYYTIAKITSDNGMRVCGYRICDIVYPYDLILSPGETVTSMLDKLIQMLGNFEYFYDVDGRFVFQKKRTYIDVSYNNIINEHSISDEVWANSGEYSSKYSYDFEGNILLSSVQNAPNFSNLKNDYSLWGARQNGNVTIPIHMRYAIDHKPLYYKVIGHTILRNAEGEPIAADGTVLDGNDSSKYVFTDEQQGYITTRGAELYPNLAGDAKVVDWREIIYQMANDYRRHYHDIDFLEQVQNNNKHNDYESFYPKGRTGYEQYYIDFEMNLSQGVVAYWRELYNPDHKGEQGRYMSWGEFREFSTDFDSTWAEGQQYPKGYRVKLVGEDGTITYWKSLKDRNNKKPSNTETYWLEIHSGDFEYDTEGWNINILNNPEILNFWFDFIDTTGELNKYGVNNIGLRSKATNDNKIKAIYFREVPNVIFETPDKVKTKGWVKPGYCYIQIPEAYMDYFHISSRGKNMMDVIEEYLYSYTYPISSITLTSIPIYYLTPNTLIYVDDKQTGIVGEYIMQKYSIQLGLGASMSISAVETAKRLY